MMKFMVLDTNILLLDANNLITLGSGGDTVVLSDVVLGEIDSKKSGFAEINYQARQVGRLLAGAKLGKIEKTDVWTTTELFIANGAMNNVRVLVVSLAEYKANRQDSSYNDKRIIEVAKVLTTKYRGVVFMTNDVLARLSALADGVEVTEFKVTEKVGYRFVKEVVVNDEELFRGMHNADVFSIDPEYDVGTFSYKFTCGVTGAVKLATVTNGFISVLGRDSEKILRAQDVPPVNAEQLLLCKAIQDPMIDIVVVEAKSGSGKTVVAFSNALKLMRSDKGKYQSIVYIRNSIDDTDKGEDIGYLSGNEEKMNVYLGPLHDTMDYVVRNWYKGKHYKPAELEEKVKEGVEKLKSDFNIQGIISLGLRGRTLHNSIVLIDEAQNMSPGTLQKILTRIGKDCKVVLMGSQRQIDSNYVNAYSNGLALIMGHCANPVIETSVGLFAIQLEKVVRSDLSAFAEDLFSKQVNKD